MIEQTPILLALIGDPVQHSVSPYMHSFFLHILKRPGCYHLFPTKKETLAEVVAGMKALSFSGFNITIPHKETILPLLDEIDADAQTIGAVNAVVIRDRKLFGFNTDCLGFARVLNHHQVQIQNQSVVVLGAGGAARAVCVHLIRAGVKKIDLFNRSQIRMIQLQTSLTRKTGFTRFSLNELSDSSLDQALTHSQVIINTTSAGMWPQIEDSPYSFEIDGAGLVAIDLIYNPLETAFLRAAKHAGASIIDGLDMLILQGVASFKLWTNCSIDLKMNYSKLRTLLIKRLTVDGTN
ncbi:MAG: shikimate dehydrogenase [bacterium]